MKTKVRQTTLYVLTAVLLAMLVSGVAGPMPAAAGGKSPGSPYPPPKTQPATGLIYRLLAKAQPDECFDAVGQPSTCGAGELPNKVNQAYLWGLTQSGDNLWFGTAPNVLCLASALLGSTDTVQNESYVCEFGSSQYVHPILGYPLGSVKPGVGDWRPPEVWAYNTTTGTKTPKTPLTDPNIYFTVGLRAAGSFGNVVFLGGPNFSNGVNLFAYNGATGQYIGSTALAEYNNIRKMLVYDGVLYLAFGSSTGGAVLKWIGSVEAPFQFETVGTLDSDAAEIVAHNGRIFVSTWPAMPGSGSVGSYSALYMSPVVPTGGLTIADAEEWEKVFQITEYEPDPVTAYTVGGGGMASFGGYLYWSTMQVPGTGLAAFEKAYGEPADDIALYTAAFNTMRPTIVFRGRDFGLTTQTVEVLYGDATLPVYDGTEWTYVPNNMSATPLYGGSGYGNFFNAYTWSMAVYNNQLYAGTFDWSWVAHVNLSQELPVGITIPNETYGADLFVFKDAKSAAKAVSYYGVGNYLNYGIRNMLVANAKLYLGSANPMNLETAAGEPNGGWELIELSTKPRK
jgi:hypothetical protein